MSIAWGNDSHIQVERQFPVEKILVFIESIVNEEKYHVFLK